MRYPAVSEFLVTTRCNSSCMHCGVGAGAAGMDVTAADAGRIVRRLSEAGVKSVVLSGGEPMMHPGIMDICYQVVSAGMGTDVLP